MRDGWRNPSHRHGATPGGTALLQAIRANIRANIRASIRANRQNAWHRRPIASDAGRDGFSGIPAAVPDLAAGHDDQPATGTRHQSRGNRLSWKGRPAASNAIVPQHPFTASVGMSNDQTGRGNAADWPVVTFNHDQIDARLSAVRFANVAGVRSVTAVLIGRAQRRCAPAMGWLGPSSLQHRRGGSHRSRLPGSKLISKTRFSVMAGAAEDLAQRFLSDQGS